MRPAPWTRPGARPCACLSRAAASPACATCSIARWGCPGPPRARRHPRRGPPPRPASPGGSACSPSGWASCSPRSGCGRSARCAALEHDAAAARRELEAARAEALDLAQAVRATAEADAERRRQLEATEARAAWLARMLGARQREIDRLRTAADARGTLAELLGAPGLEVLRLAAVAPFRDVRGHLLWDPAHDTVLLYASGLPPLPAASTYQVRLGFDDGREQAGPSFRPDGRGALALSVGLGRAAEQLRAVRVLLEPGAEPVL